MASIDLAATTISYEENSVALPLAERDTLSGLDNIGNFDGFTLTGQLSGNPQDSGLAGDRLTIQPGGGITVRGRRILFNQTSIGQFQGGFGTEPLTIQLLGNVSLTTVQQLIQQVSYSNVANALPSGDRNVTLTLQKAGVASATGNRAISVTGIDDAPVALQTITLYDGSSNAAADSNGAAPGAPWLFYQDSTRFIDGEANRQTNGGKTILTSDNAAFAGLSNYDVRPNLFTLSITSDIVNPDFPTLDRSQGYTLSFDAKLISETVNPNSVDENQDGRNDHAGFNVLLLSSDQRGIELSFEKNTIWADEDGITQADPSKEPDQSPRDNTRTLFTQAEGTDFDTTQLTQYDLTVKGEIYQLFANDQPILSGKLRDYSTFQPDSFEVLGRSITPPNPYETPNLVFIGDNTPAAGAQIEIASVAISTALPNGQLPSSGPGSSQPRLRIEDADSDNSQLIATIAAPSGNLTINDGIPNGLSSSQISGNGSSSVTLTGTQQQINTSLDGNALNYAPANGNNAPLAVSVTSAPDVPPEAIGSLTLVSRTTQTTIQNGRVQTQALRPEITNENWQLSVSGNFTGGAAPDFVWHNPKTGQVVLWQDGGTSSSALPRVNASDWEILGTGLFNGDNNLDLLWYDPATQRLAVWYMDGQGNVGDRASLTFTNAAATNLQGYELQGSGDFDGNGAPDLLWVNAAGNARISAVNGTSIESPLDFSAPQALTSQSATPALVQGIGDYNQDGRDDLAIGSGNSIVQIWLMNGASAPQVVNTQVG